MHKHNENKSPKNQKCLFWVAQMESMICPKGGLTRLKIITFANINHIGLHFWPIEGDLFSSKVVHDRFICISSMWF